MAGQAHLAAGAVANQEIQGSRVDILDVWVMAAFTLHATVQKLNPMWRTRRIRSLFALHQTLYQVRSIF